MGRGRIWLFVVLTIGRSMECLLSLFHGQEVFVFLIMNVHGVDGKDHVIDTD